MEGLSIAELGLELVRRAQELQKEVDRLKARNEILEGQVDEFTLENQSLKRLVSTLRQQDDAVQQKQGVEELSDVIREDIKLARIHQEAKALVHQERFRDALNMYSEAVASLQQLDFVDQLDSELVCSLFRMRSVLNFRLKIPASRDNLPTEPIKSMVLNDWKTSAVIATVRKFAGKNDDAMKAYKFAFSKCKDPKLKQVLKMKMTELSRSSR
jgi:hypothetical protein